MTAPRLALFGAAAVCALLSWGFAVVACGAWWLPYEAAIAVTWCCLAAACVAAYAVARAVTL